MVLVDIDAYIEESYQTPNDDIYTDNSTSRREKIATNAKESDITITTYHNGNGAATPQLPKPPMTIQSRRNNTTTSITTVEALSSCTTTTATIQLPKTIPLGQRVNITKKKRKKLPPSVAMRAQGTTSTTTPTSRGNEEPQRMVNATSTTTPTTPNHRRGSKTMSSQKIRTVLSSSSSSSGPTTTNPTNARTPISLSGGRGRGHRRRQHDVGMNSIRVTSSSSASLASQQSQPQQLPTIEELSLTQSDSESIASSSSLRSRHSEDGLGDLHNDAPTSRPMRRPLPPPLLLLQPQQPTLPAITPIASWEYSSSSSSSSNGNGGSYGNNSYTNNSPSNVPLTVITSKDIANNTKTKKKQEKVFVVRASRNLSRSLSLSSQNQHQQQQLPDTVDVDASTIMTPKRSNISTTVAAFFSAPAEVVVVPPTVISSSSSLMWNSSRKINKTSPTQCSTVVDPTDSPTTVVEVDDTIPTMDIENCHDPDLERQNVPQFLKRTSSTVGPSITPPSPTRVGCVRLRSPTIIRPNAMNEKRSDFCSDPNHNSNDNIGNSSNDGVSSTSSSSSLRTANNTKWERVCKFRSLLYVLVFVLLACIVVLSISVVLRNNQRSTVTSNADDISYNSPTATMGNVGSAPRTQHSPVPVETPISSHTMSQPPNSQQQTVEPVPAPMTESPSPPVTTTTTASPASVDLSTVSPSSSTNSGGQDGGITYKKRVPIISMNCGGPTLNMVTTRESVNSNNVTSIKNSTVLWESDVYYNTDFYFGSSRIRSKTNLDSCQDYIIPENSDTNGTTRMDSIVVFEDRGLNALYCTERFFVDGFGGYEIPVDTVGRFYRIELYMMESFHTDINQRVFDIVIEDEIQESNFDIFAEAGGRHKKIVSSHTVYVSDASISIYLNATINFPLINAISISYLLQE